MFLHVVDAKYLVDYKIALRFNDGVEGEVDLSDLSGPVFEPLKNIEYFKRFNLDSYPTLCWPNGADLAPEFLYRKITGKYPDYVDENAQ